MRDISQIERQLYLLSLLSESIQGYRISELEKKLNMIGIDVSKRTLERDIDFLSTGNFFVTEEKRNGKNYYMAKKFGVDNIIFSPSELISFHFIKELLKSYSMLDIGCTAGYMIDKIINNLPQVDKAYIEMLNELLKVKESYIGLEKHLNEEIIGSIRKGIELKKRLLIKYYSFNRNEVTEREFAPYIIEIYEGCYHLIGHCYLRGSIRDLRISRIQEVKFTDESFERPKKFYENYKKGRFGKLRGEEQIELLLRFKGDAARYVIEYEGAKADALIEEDGETLLFQKSTTMTPEIIKWVLSFGSSVTVLEPKEVREAVIEHAKGMLEGYGDRV